MARSEPTPKKLDRKTYRQIGVACDLETRAVRSYFEQLQNTRPATAVVIRLALAKLGLPDPHPPKAATKPSARRP
jgi:hypothetical protein